MAMPGYLCSNIAEMPPSARPSRKRINRRGHGRPFFSEDRNERHDEAAENTSKHPGKRCFRRFGMRQAPGPRSGDHYAKQQQAGLVYRALKRHRFAVGNLAPERSFI